MNKQMIIEKHRISPDDTGSPQVQVALLNNRIERLVEHLKKHRMDDSSRKGLLILVGKRRRLLSYIGS